MFAMLPSFAGAAGTSAPAGKPSTKNVADGATENLLFTAQFPELLFALVDVAVPTTAPPSSLEENTRSLFWLNATPAVAHTLAESSEMQQTPATKGDVVRATIPSSQPVPTLRPQVAPPNLTTPVTAEPTAAPATEPTPEISSAVLPSSQSMPTFSPAAARVPASPVGTPPALSKLVSPAPVAVALSRPAVQSKSIAVKGSGIPAGRAPAAVAPAPAVQSQVPAVKDPPMAANSAPAASAVQPGPTDVEPAERAAQPYTAALKDPPWPNHTERRQPSRAHRQQSHLHRLRPNSTLS